MKHELIEVTLELTNMILGTIPKDKKIFSTYVESKKPEDQKEDESTSVANIEEGGSTGFHQDKTGIFLYDYVIKGFFKNAGNVLKTDLGIKALRSKLSDFMFIIPRKIYFEPNKTAADGVLERSLRVQTMQGPRTCLARSDYIEEGVKLSFTIKLLKHKEITVDKLAELLEYGELCGLGQWRNGSLGTFKVVSFK